MVSSLTQTQLRSTTHTHRGRPTRTLSVPGGIFPRIPMVRKTQSDLVKIRLPLQPRNYLSTLGLGVRQGVRPKPFRALQGVGGAVQPPQLPTAASHGITGSNHRGEEGRFHSWRNTLCPRSQSSLQQSEPETPGHSTPVLRLGFGKNFQTFSSSIALVLVIIYFLHFWHSNRHERG